MKKLLAILMALVMVLSCTAAFAEGETWKIPDPTWYMADEPDIPIEERFQLTDEEKASLVQFSTFIPGTTANGHIEHDQLSTPIGRAIAKLTGYAQYMYYISGEKEQALQLALASDSWDYDTIWLGIKDKWVQELAESEIITPITKYFYDEENYPNLYAIPDDVKANLMYNGEIYGVPYGWYVEEEPETGEYWRAAGWYVNKSILEQVGWTPEQIVTIEDVEAVCKAIVEANLTTEDGLPIIPISGGQNFNSRTTLANTWGVSTAGKGYDWYDGELINYRQHEGTKAAMEWFNKMWKAGYVDQELFSHSNDVLNEKLLANRVAIIADTAWPFWSVMTVGHTVASDNMVPIVVPQVEGVEKLGINATYATLGNEMLSFMADCENIDEIMKYCDMLQNTSSATLNNTFVYGPRGLRWDCLEEDVSAMWFLTDSEWNADTSWAGYAKLGGWHQGIRYMPLPFYFNSNQTEIAPTVEDGKTAIFWVQEMHIFNKVNKMDCATRDLDLATMPLDGAYATYSSVMGTVDAEYLSACITAEDFEAAWETYQNELESQAHISEMNEEFEVALGEYQAANEGSSVITQLVAE